ncbi:hypothetical protein Pla175_36810 [Pirellulimonas nuda]|uniref:Uncharacterized protein n=1 Tax=Pirellulimonas nuda TaxID=2528009 RepID=A0A518DFP6_9BACT|nr:hypothetical protein Pla175_36810 [Pirellulimonas nuda]
MLSKSFCAVRLRSLGRSAYGVGRTVSCGRFQTRT